MNTFLRKAAFIFAAIVISANVWAVNFITWKFNNLTTIGENTITVSGDPEIFTINNDSACFFDGDADRIAFDDCPIETYGSDFTIETIFRVDGGDEQEQKFIHVQADNDARILFELEFEEDGTWRMETYVKTTDGSDIHLIDSNSYFQPNRWYHAALVYHADINEFEQYINYKNTNSQLLSWNQAANATVSVGARGNEANYMTGAVRQIRYADEALESKDFLLYGELLDQNELFVIDNLQSINGHDLSVFGSPNVVSTDLGDAVEFNGGTDGMYVNTNPLGSSSRFTIETIIQPYAVAPPDTQPRYLHIEDPNDGNRRITMELRVSDDDPSWYFDGFVKSPVNNLTLIDQTLTHPIEDNKWDHLAITYGDGVFTTYANYTPELTGEVTYLPISNDGIISLGMRMNKRNYYHGLIQRVRVTQAVLDTSEFMLIYPDTAKDDTKTADETFADNETVSFGIYPNPASEISSVKITSANTERVLISLYNLSGVKVDEVSGNLQAGKTTETPIHVSQLPKGVYLVRIQTERYTGSKRLVIQ